MSQKLIFWSNWTMSDYNFEGGLENVMDSSLRCTHYANEFGAS